jgi:hypothetical protein
VASIGGRRQAWGNVKVHEQGTANVNVTNSTLQVEQAIEPLSLSLCSLGDICGTTPGSYTVPVGKRLVVQYLNGECVSATDLQLIADGHIFEFKLEPIGSVYGFSEQVTIYAGFVNLGGDCTLEVSGYLMSP